MTGPLAETDLRTGLRVLSLALAVSVVAELSLISSSLVAGATALMSRIFLLGATAALLSQLGPGASASSASTKLQRIQSRPLLLAVLATLLATLMRTIDDATMTILWAETPLGLLIVMRVVGALLPLMALTMTTVALTPFDGRGIATVALSTMLAFAGAGVVFAGLGGSDLPWLGPLLRAASTALTLFTLISRFSIFETQPRPSTRERRAAMALAAEPLWRDALLGARLLRAAELTRLIVMVLVFLLGFALLPLGPAWLVPLLIGQDLALVFVALTTLLGLLRLSRIPAASGARGAAFAGLALAVITLIQVAGGAAVDLALIVGRPDLSLSLSLDTATRFSTLGTIVAVCLAVLAIARSAEHPALGRRAMMAAVFYVAATLCLTASGHLGETASVPAVLLKLAALMLFSAGFLRLVRALTEVGPLIENERRRALSHEFA